MSKNNTNTDFQVCALTDEAARKRWELFHRAIAHAKKSNAQALLEAESASSEPPRSGPMLSVAR